MRIALLHDRTVNAELCLRPADYRCVECGQKVILCQGRKKGSYFAHQHHELCGSVDGETP